MRERIHSIDALRGIAALGVSVFYHFRYLTGDLTFTHPEAAPLGYLPGMHWLYANGDGLVDLFFVLSGFIFCYIYRPDPASIKVTSRAFFVYRFARLYPILILTTLIMAAIMLTSQTLYGSTYGGLEVSWAEGLKHLLFLKSGVVHGSLNAAAWSISVEVACYVLFLIAATRGERTFLTVCAVMVLIGLLAMQNVLPAPMKDWWLPRGLVGFFTGCLLHRALPLLDRIPTLVIGIGALIGFYLATTQPPVLHHVQSFGRLSTITWPLVIAFALRAGPSKILSWRPFSVLGDLSYSIYLWHIPVAALILLVNAQAPFVPGDALMVSNGIVVLIVGYVSFRWIETPSRMWLRKFAKPSQPISLPPALAQQPTTSTDSLAAN